MRARLNHAWNIFCFAFFFSVMAGLLFFAAGLVENRAIGAFVMIGAGFWTLVTIYLRAETLRYHLKRYADSHEYSPNLRRMVDQLCIAAGKNPADVPVCEFDTSTEKTMTWSQKRSLAGYILISKTHNALARSDMMIVSAPLLKLLDDAEEKAILAHEMAHIAFRHSFFYVIMNVMTYMILWLATTYFWVSCYAAGWKVLALAAAGIIVLPVITRNICPNLISRGDVFARRVVYAGLVIHNLAFIKVIVMGFVLRRLAYICGALYSQTCEYMTDKGAVDLGANPLALALALRKITFLMQRSQQKFSKHKLDFSREGLLNAYRRLYRTHPPDEKRVERLCHIAYFTLGIPWAEMQKTRRGNIDLPADHDIPEDVVRTFMNV